MSYKNEDSPFLLKGSSCTLTEKNKFSMFLVIFHVAVLISDIGFLYSPIGYEDEDVVIVNIDIYKSSPKKQIDLTTFENDIEIYFLIRKYTSF